MHYLRPRINAFLATNIDKRFFRYVSRNIFILRWMEYLIIDYRHCFWFSKHQHEQQRKKLDCDSTIFMSDSHKHPYPNNASWRSLSAIFSGRFALLVPPHGTSTFFQEVS
jgi:hypothetical protein